MLNTDSDTENSTRISTGTQSTYNKKTAQAISRRARLEIKYHILEDAVQYTMDHFWKDKLMDAARGKFPKGFYYQDGCVVYNKNNKEKRILLPITPLEAANAFIQFFHEIGIRSDRDIEYAKLDASMRIDTYVPKPLIWTKIQKRMKVSMLKTYARKMAATWNLTAEAAKDFQTVLEIGFRNDALNKDNIEFDGTGIVHIRDVYMDEKTGKFFIDPAILGEAIRVREKEHMRSARVKVDLSKYPNPVFEPIGVDFSVAWRDYVNTFRQTFPEMAVTLAEKPSIIQEDDFIVIEF